MSKEIRRLGFQFKQIHDALESHLNRNLKKQNLTMSQMNVLWFLFEHRNEIITQKDIEKFLSLKHPTVVGIIKRMECKGFIESTTNAEDRRYRNITLTDKAFEVKQDMEKSRNIMEARLAYGLTEDQIDMLNILLGKVYKNIGVNKYE